MRFSISLFLCAIVFFLMYCIAYSQIRRVTEMHLKRVPIDLPVNYLLQHVVVDSSDFQREYGSKHGREARVCTLFWSPNDRFLSFTVSEIRTGDFDDVWLVDLLKRRTSCISCKLACNLFNFQNVWTINNTLIYEAAGGGYVKYLPVEDSIYFVKTSLWGDRLLNSLNMKEKCMRPVKYVNGGKLEKLADQFTTEGYSTDISVSPDSSYLIWQERVVNWTPANIGLLNLKNNHAYLLKVPVQNYGEFIALAQAWNMRQGIVSITDSDGLLELVDIRTRTDYIIGFKDFYVDGAVWSNDDKQLAIILYNKRGSARMVSVIDNPVK